MDTTFTRRFAPSMRPTWLLIIVAALILATATVALVVGNLPQRLPAPFGLADNGALVFPDDGDIVTLTPDGTPTVIVAGPTNDFSPWFSRDGTTFAFLREERGESLHLMAADSDGSNVRSLTAEPLFQPDWWEWSPSGTQLVVFHTVETRRVISILDADGSGTLTTLDLGDVVPEGWVDWRPPNGQELIFRGSPRDRGTSRGLFAIRADGSGLREIAPVLPSELAYQDIDLAPDGSQLLYWSWEADDSSDAAGGYTHLLDLAKGVEATMGFDSRSEEAIRAIFSPDGTKVVMVGRDPARLLLASTDPAVPSVVEIGPTFSFDAQYSFDFSPDGQEVIQTIVPTTRVFRISDGVMLSESTHDFPTWQRVAP